MTTRSLSDIRSILIGVKSVDIFHFVLLGGILHTRNSSRSYPPRPIAIRYRFDLKNAIFNTARSS
jgi:hypothetical protein